MSSKFPKYKYLITYRLSEIIFDLVDAFVLKYLSHLGSLSYLSLKDQILKCARSIKQNIIEGVSEVVSLKSQIKLLGVAYASTEELIADLEDFLRRKNFALYPKNHPKVVEFRRLGTRLSSLSNLNSLGVLKEKPALPASPEEATNLILTLCHQLSFLLHRQIKATENKFVQEGGYTENLFLKRLNKKKLNKLNLTKSHFPIQGFTLLEVVIVVLLISLLIIAGFVLMNPKKQIEKAWDAKRKKDLDTIKKILEDYYNDKNCYPKAEEISYQIIAPGQGYICGNEKSSPNFQPYINKLPCDPQNPIKRYLYLNENSSCPSNYRIYAILSENINQAGSNQYNYGISSGNINLQPYPTVSYLIPSPPNAYSSSTPISPTSPYASLIPCPLDPTYKYCYKGEICNVCGSFSQCQEPTSCNQPLQLYSDGLCSEPCSLP